METYVESLKKSMTEQRLLEQRFLEDVEYDDTALEDMYSAHRVPVYHSQARLLVSRRLRPKER